MISERILDELDSLEGFSAYHHKQRFTDREGLSLVMVDLNCENPETPEALRHIMAYHRMRFQEYYDDGYHYFVGIQRKGMAYLVNAIWPSAIPHDRIIDHRRMQRGTDLPKLTGSRVVVVDDTIRTGDTMYEVLTSAQTAGVARAVAYSMVGRNDGVDTIREDFPGFVTLQPHRPAREHEYGAHFPRTLFAMNLALPCNSSDFTNARRDFACLAEDESHQVWKAFDGLLSSDMVEAIIHTETRPQFFILRTSLRFRPKFLKDHGARSQEDVMARLAVFSDDDGLSFWASVDCCYGPDATAEQERQASVAIVTQLLDSIEASLSTLGKPIRRGGWDCQGTYLP